MKKTYVACIMLLISPYLKSEIAFTQIKGLYNSLPAPYQYLSPLHGFNWWYIGIIENYYRFGDEASDTIKLIKEIFYLQPDNITFDVTTLTRKIAKYFTPRTIGKIITLIDSYKIPLNATDMAALKEKLYAAISNDLSLDVLIEKSQASIADKRTQLEQIKQYAKRRATLSTIIVRNKKRLEKLNKEREETPDLKKKKALAAKNQQEAEQEFATINPIVEQRKQVERIIHNNDLNKRSLDDFITYLIGSLNETNQQQYPPYTTHVILLAVLWKITNDKTDFLTYFKEVGISIPNDHIWKHETYTRDEFEIFKTALTAKPTLILDDYELSSFYAFARKAWASTFLPIIISSIADAEYNTGKKILYFADCGETSLRNFFNILIFNPLNGTLDFNILQQTATKNKLTLLPSVGQYYKVYNQMPYIQTKQYYDAWVPVVSNLPGVQYSQVENYEISPGLSNMLNVFNVLLFGNNSAYKAMSNTQKLDYLVNTLSRIGFVLTWHAEKGEFFEEDSDAPDTQKQGHRDSSVDVNHYNVGINIVFTVNNKESFVWKFDDDHFVIEKPQKQTSTIDNQLSIILAPKIHDLTARNLIGWFTHATFFQTLLSSISSTVEKTFLWMTLPLKNPNVVSELWPVVFGQSGLSNTIINNILSLYPTQLETYADMLGTAIVESNAAALYPLLNTIHFGGKTVGALAKAKNSAWHPLIIKNIESTYDKWDSISDHDSYIASFDIPELLAIPRAAELISQFNDLITLENAINTIEEENEDEYKTISMQIQKLLQSPSNKNTKPLENVAAAILHMDNTSDVLDDLLRTIITETKNNNIIYHVLEHHTERFYTTTHPLILKEPSLNKYALNLVDENDDLSFKTLQQIIQASTDEFLLEKIATKIRSKNNEALLPLADEIDSLLNTTGKQKAGAAGADQVYISTIINSIIQFAQNLLSQVVAKFTF